MQARSRDVVKHKERVIHTITANFLLLETGKGERQRKAEEEIDRANVSMFGPNAHVAKWNSNVLD